LLLFDVVFCYLHWPHILKCIYENITWPRPFACPQLKLRHLQRTKYQPKQAKPEDTRNLRKPKCFFVSVLWKTLVLEVDSYLVISVGSNISLHAAYAFKWSLLFAQGKVFESEFYKDALKISCMSSYSDTCMTFREKYVLKKSTKTKFFTHLWHMAHTHSFFYLYCKKRPPFFQNSLFISSIFETPRRNT
jgi:hypothetical protein